MKAEVELLGIPSQRNISQIVDKTAAR